MVDILLNCFFYTEVVLKNTLFGFRKQLREALFSYFCFQPVQKILSILKSNSFTETDILKQIAF